ncbi:SLOG family protein [Streptomyces formicae]|uniref:DUF2493 domain-containing protein n=1 Tax=Streptomyces formicae TaxID=1616117 RepID=A0ABY3WI72_9ACTN|nr:SLOG family protein [Streptomyces formicae]UNM12299.1 DUF2493 domain-containing protein [Streptomyces formicae]
MRVIVTGSRKWTDRGAVYGALETLRFHHGAFMLVHGACATGADAIAEEWFEILGRRGGCERVKYKAAWETRGKAAGPERNQRMIEAGADLVLAFPLPEGSGTQHTMKLAAEAGIEVRVIEHE